MKTTFKDSGTPSPHAPPISMGMILGTIVDPDGILERIDKAQPLMQVEEMPTTDLINSYETRYPTNACLAPLQHLRSLSEELSTGLYLRWRNVNPTILETYIGPPNSLQPFLLPRCARCMSYSARRSGRLFCAIPRITRLYLKGRESASRVKGSISS